MLNRAAHRTGLLIGELPRQHNGLPLGPRAPQKREGLRGRLHELASRFGRLGLLNVPLLRRLPLPRTLFKGRGLFRHSARLFECASKRRDLSGEQLDGLKRRFGFDEPHQLA